MAAVTTDAGTPVKDIAPATQINDRTSGSRTTKGRPILRVPNASTSRISPAWRRHNGDLTAVFAETGLAVVVTIATSIAAFGAFIVATSPSLAQFGAQAAGALLGCLIVTLWLLPVILRHRLAAEVSRGQ